MRVLERHCHAFVGGAKTRCYQRGREESPKPGDRSVARRRASCSAARKRSPWAEGSAHAGWLPGTSRLAPGFAYLPILSLGISGEFTCLILRSRRSNLAPGNARRAGRRDVRDLQARRPKHADARAPYRPKPPPPTPPSNSSRATDSIGGRDERPPPSRHEGIARMHGHASADEPDQTLGDEQCPQGRESPDGKHVGMSARPSFGTLDRTRRLAGSDQIRRQRDLEQPQHHQVEADRQQHRRSSRVVELVDLVKTGKVRLVDRRLVALGSLLHHRQLGEVGRACSASRKARRGIPPVSIRGQRRDVVRDCGSTFTALRTLAAACESCPATG